MQDVETIRPDTAALLSAATASSEGDAQIPALLDVGGEPVISHQIRTLRHLGIDRFYIEVDQVPGALLAICDKLRQNGVTVDLVRSPKELAQKIAVSMSLFAVAEGVMADPKILGELMAKATPFIATVDGRDENSSFERMDLNTRWAGLALFDRHTISSVATLPSGWSIASSLLRQAMQQGVPQTPLKQVQLQDQKLCLVTAPEDADAMTKKLLSARASGAGGVVESTLFGAAAKWIAPKIWRNDLAKKAVPAVSGLSALAAVPMAWFGFDLPASFASLLSIFGLSVMTTMTSREEGGVIRKFAGIGISTALAAALGAALWQWPSTALFDLFPGIMLVGLMIHARQMPLPRRAKMILASPALTALALMVSALFGRVAEGTILLSILYLATLIASRFMGEKPVADNGQA